MHIAAADIRPGKCFLIQGAKPSVVRVLSVKDGVVRFESKLRPRVWTRRGEAPVSEFVGGLLKEVGSDFQPGAGRVHVEAP